MTIETSLLLAPPSTVALPRPWRSALFSSVALSLVFFMVYGACTAITARRTDIGSAYFAWELQYIPFIPVMIVPYMSIERLFLSPLFSLDGL